MAVRGQAIWPTNIQAGSSIHADLTFIGMKPNEGTRVNASNGVARVAGVEAPVGSSVPTRQSSVCYLLSHTIEYLYGTPAQRGQRSSRRMEFEGHR